MTTTTTNLFNGAKVVVTGKAQGKTRKEVEAEVASLGGDVCPAVTSAFDILLVCPNQGYSKPQAAKEKNAWVLSYADFQKSAACGLIVGLRKA